LHLWRFAAAVTMATGNKLVTSPTSRWGGIARCEVDEWPRSRNATAAIA
jgi:hypothetical protein